MDSRLSLEAIAQKWIGSKLDSKKPPYMDYEKVLEPLYFEIKSLVGFFGDLPDVSSPISQAFQEAVTTSMCMCFYIGFELADDGINRHDAVSLVGVAITPIEDVVKRFLESLAEQVTLRNGKFPEEGPWREVLDLESNRAARIVKASVETGVKYMDNGVEHYQHYQKKIKWPWS